MGIAGVLYRRSIFWHDKEREFEDVLGTVDAETVAATDCGRLQSLGISLRKADYIKDFAGKVMDGTFDPDGIWEMPDDEDIAELTMLRGVGVCTAEMILLFCMERPDILSFNDLAIQRGLCMLYHHSTISRELFENTGSDIPRTAAWPACISGPWPAGRWRDRAYEI